MLIAASIGYQRLWCRRRRSCRRPYSRRSRDVVDGSWSDDDDVDEDHDNRGTAVGRSSSPSCGKRWRGRERVARLSNSSTIVLPLQLPSIPPPAPLVEDSVDDVVEDDPVAPLSAPSIASVPFQSVEILAPCRPSNAGTSSAAANGVGSVGGGASAASKGGAANVEHANLSFRNILSGATGDCYYSDEVCALMSQRYSNMNMNAYVYYNPAVAVASASASVPVEGSAEQSCRRA